MGQFHMIKYWHQTCMALLPSEVHWWINNGRGLIPAGISPLSYIQWCDTAGRIQQGIQPAPIIQRFFEEPRNGWL